MDFNQIQELIRLVSKSKVSEFIYKDGDTKLVIRNQQSGESQVAATPVVIPAAPSVVAVPQTIAQPIAAPAPKPETTAPPAEKPSGGENAESKLIAIKSPMVGTFYRSPSPDKAPFVKVGDSVDKGTIVCMIEAMKLFNEIESELKGKIVKVLVEDSTPVEYDQPLFLLEP